jgi:hypothetical protein
MTPWIASSPFGLLAMTSVARMKPVARNPGIPHFASLHACYVERYRADKFDRVPSLLRMAERFHFSFSSRLVR